MKYLAFLLLISASIYAETNPISDTIISYYLAAKIENLNVFMKYTDTSNMTGEQVNATRQLLTDVWSRYKVDYHVIKNLVIFQDGNWALATYELDTTVSGAESLTYDLNYTMLLHRVNSDWLIVYAMPMGDYLQATDQLAYATGVRSMAYSMGSSPSSGVTFSGLAMGDLNASLQSGLNACATDGYCVSRGFLWCDNSTCTNVPRPVINNTPNMTNATSNSTSNVSGNVSTNTTINTTANATGNTTLPPANISLNTTHNNTPANVSQPKNITITIPEPQIPKNTPCLPAFLLIPLAILLAWRPKK